MDKHDSSTSNRHSTYVSVTRPFSQFLGGASEKVLKKDRLRIDCNLWPKMKVFIFHLIPFSPPVIVACSTGHADKVMIHICNKTLQFKSDNFMNTSVTNSFLLFIILSVVINLSLTVQFSVKLQLNGCHQPPADAGFVQKPTKFICIQILKKKKKQQS